MMAENSLVMKKCDASWCTSLMSRLYDMYEEDTLCDVKITSSDEKILNAHSHVLYASSPLLASALHADISCSNWHLAIDSPADILTVVLQFIYTGQVDAHDSPFIYDLLQCSENLQIPALTILAVQLLDEMQQPQQLQDSSTDKVYNETDVTKICSPDKFVENLSQNDMEIEVTADASRLPDNITHKKSVSLENVTQKECISLENVTQKECSSLENVNQKESMSLENVTQKESVSLENVTHKESVSLENVTQKESISLENKKQKDTRQSEIYNGKKVIIDIKHELLELDRLKLQETSKFAELPVIKTEPVDRPCDASSIDYCFDSGNDNPVSLEEIFPDNVEALVTLETAAQNRQEAEQHNSSIRVDGSKVKSEKQNCLVNKSDQLTIGLGAYLCQFCSKIFRKHKHKNHHEHYHHPNAFSAICDLQHDVQHCSLCKQATGDKTRADLKRKYVSDSSGSCHDKLKCNENKKSIRDISDRKESVECLVSDQNVMDNIAQNDEGLKQNYYFCEICNMSFAKSRTLQTHKRTHFAEKINQCAFCGLTFPKRAELTYHERLHTGNKLYHCKHCRLRFTRRAKCEEHERVHSDFKMYPCTYDGCTRRFRSKQGRQGHINSQHTGELPFHCKICPKRFPASSQLWIHTNRHNKVRRYPCELCTTRFDCRQDLERHILVHSGERPFECNLCDKSYTRKVSLNAHLRSHTGELPFTCEVCGISFNTRSNLQGHYDRNHASIRRTFPCDHCDKSFKKKQDLNKHLNKIHQIQQPKIKQEMSL